MNTDAKPQPNDIHLSVMLVGGSVALGMGVLTWF